jgi:hypothetical protein
MSERVTPTGLAEDVYQANLNAKFERRMKPGPAGIPIPPPTQLYRKTVDGPLLTRIINTAYASYRSKILGPDRRNAVAASLQVDLVRRFPVEDMRILERYGFASPREFSFVEILAGDYEPAERIALPDRPLMPNQATNFHVDLGGRGSSAAAPVPADAVAYFRDLIEVRRRHGPGFASAHNWVGIFRTKNGRFPMWGEIEHQFPLIGEWLESQRNG